MAAFGSPTRDRAPAVHPTALVDRRAEISDGVRIGAFCIVEAGVSIGPGTTLETGSQLLTGASVGAGNLIGPYAILGGAPMDLKFQGEPSRLFVGDNNRIREFSTLHRATGEGEATRVGSGNFIMAYVHVTHNCTVGDGNVIANNAQIAGHVDVGDHVTFGGSVAVHQYCRIGSGAMLGMHSKVARDVPPFTLADGHPAQLYGLNVIGLRRAGLTAVERWWLQETLRLYRNRLDWRGVLELAPEIPQLRALVSFLASPSKRGSAAFAGRGEPLA